MTKLHDDKCRCEGQTATEQCTRRTHCMRWLQRETGRMSAPMMCGYIYTREGGEFLDYQLEAQV